MFSHVVGEEEEEEKEVLSKDNWTYFCELKDISPLTQKASSVPGKSKTKLSG